MLNFYSSVTIINMKFIYFGVLLLAYNTFVTGQSVVEIDCTIESALSGCIFENIELTNTNYRFKPLARSPELVKNLEFKNSSVAGFSRTICDTFSNLERIVINDIKLEFFEEGALDNCPKLVYLYVHMNRLESLPKNLFKYNKEVQIITLERNVLKSLDRKQFSGLEKLGFLDVSGNYLEEFHVDSVTDTDLSVLYLYSNDISYLNMESIIDALPNLQFIGYNNNELPCDRVRYMNALAEENGILVYDNTYSRKRFYETDSVDDIECLPDKSWVTVMQKKEFEARYKK